MMRFNWSGTASSIVGVAFLLAAGFFCLSGLGLAALKCVECDCQYNLSTPGCRSPVIYLWMAAGAFVSAALLLAIAVISRRKKKLLS